MGLIEEGVTIVEVPGHEEYVTKRTEEETVNVGTIGHVDHGDRQRVVVIGGAAGMGAQRMLTVLASIGYVVEHVSEEQLDKIQGLDYDSFSFDEAITCHSYEEGFKPSRGKGKKNKPWENSYV